MDTSTDFLLRLLGLVPMILSLTVHEYAHAWSAYRLGDDTAQRQGRLTLNPLSHIDPFGTLLLPLIGVPFGWARPVPVNPANFTRRFSTRTGWMLTAAAGPAANFLLAFLCAVAFGLLARFAPERLAPGSPEGGLLRMALGMNVGLALFNLLPVPPLDGSRIAERFVPARLQGTWESFARISPILLLVVFAAGGSLLSGPRILIYRLLNQVVVAVAG